MRKQDWAKSSFPFNTPASRSDAIMLDRWLDKKLKEFSKTGLNNIVNYEEGQSIFAKVMHELIRQVIFTNLVIMIRYLFIV